MKPPPFDKHRLERLRDIYLASQAANGARAMLARAQEQLWAAYGRPDLAKGCAEDATDIESAEAYEGDLLVLLEWAIAQSRPPARRLKAVGR